MCVGGGGGGSNSTSTVLGFSYERATRKNWLITGDFIAHSQNSREVGGVVILGCFGENLENQIRDQI